ncbi:MAG: thiamine-phosphate pyrophosphorylase [bacterium]
MSSDNVFQILDVNLNRAREGIRVIEDTLRLVLKNKKLYQRLRSLRHELDVISRKLYGSLITSRSSEKDLGRKSPAIRFRSIDDMVRANFRRAQEALRVLEEYSRFINVLLTPRFQKIRFTLYQLEKSVHVRKM